MIVERLENMNIIRAEDGYELFWNNSFVSVIYVPASRDVEEVKAECVLYTYEEAEVKREELALEAEATEEDYLAALEALGVSE